MTTPHTQKNNVLIRGILLATVIFGLALAQPVLAFQEVSTAKPIIHEPVPLPRSLIKARSVVQPITEINTPDISAIQVATSTKLTLLCRDAVALNIDGPNTVANLIANPSVETVSTTSSSLPAFWYKGGYGTNTRTLTYPVTGKNNCGKGIKSEITNFTDGDATWYFQDVPVTPGQSYTYSDYFKSSIPSTVTIQYTRQDGTMCWPDLSVNIPASSGWSKFTSTFTVPTGAPCASPTGSPIKSLSIFHLIDRVGWVVTDDFLLTQFVPDPVNLFYNPSVEIQNGSGTMPDGWLRATSLGSEATYTYPESPAQHGQKAAKVQVTSYTGGAGAKWYPGYVAVQGGDEYTFSNYYKSDTDSFIVVQFEMGVGSQNYTYLDLMRLVPSPLNWKKAEDTFIVPQGATGLTVIHLIQSVGSLTVDNYSLTKLPSGKFNNGMITLHFDDGPISIWNNGRPIFNAPTTTIATSQNVITQYIQNPEPDYYMTPAQWMILKNENHEIDAHSRTHAHLMSLSDTDLLNEVSGSRTDLITAGFNPQAFVYPYGEYNDKVKEAVIAAGFRGARSVRRGFNTKNTNPFELVDQSVTASTTPAQVISYINQAIADKTWLILELHDIGLTGSDVYHITPADLQTIITYIKSSGIQVVQTSQGLSAMGY